MPGRTDPDSVRIEITRDDTGEVFTPPAAARDQIVTLDGRPDRSGVHQGDDRERSHADAGAMSAPVDA